MVPPAGTTIAGTSTITPPGRAFAGTWTITPPGRAFAGSVTLKLPGGAFAGISTLTPPGGAFAGTWTHDARGAFGGSATISVLPPAGPSRNDRTAPGCSTVAGDAVARTTERATTAPARIAAATQPAPRLVSAFRAPSPRRRRSGRGIPGSVTGGGAPAAEGSEASAPAGCSCSSTSAHLTVGTVGTGGWFRRAPSSAVGVRILPE